MDTPFHNPIVRSNFDNLFTLICQIVCSKFKYLAILISQIVRSHFDNVSTLICQIILTFQLFHKMVKYEYFHKNYLEYLLSELSLFDQNPYNIALLQFKNVPQQNFLETGQHIATVLIKNQRNKIGEKKDNLMALNMTRHAMHRTVGDTSCQASSLKIRLLRNIEHITVEEEVQQAMAITRQNYGRLDVLVNCAGVGTAIKTYNDNKKRTHDMEKFSKVMQIACKV
ncbi:hypothetical protein KUTeg_020252 [Tegillarca granosa]|uniref:Uncharacterized protein n=1 Tax=Tegillarca granosa TaxID=220873 RepID=A0ABQ9E7X1_TEGGR|nr:hypothetical protein KUTeg_020252 [Tegillarca granosa]